MKVFIVMRNDKIDQVFFNVDPVLADTDGPSYTNYGIRITW